MSVIVDEKVTKKISCTLMYWTFAYEGVRISDVVVINLSQKSTMARPVTCQAITTTKLSE